VIDNSGRIKGKVSLIDIILVVAVVLLLAGFVRNTLSPHIQDIINPDTPFEVVITGSELRHFIVDSVNVGDVMFRNHDRQPLGTVTDIEIVPFQDVLHRSDGTAVLVDHEGRYTIRITLESVGTIRNVGYFINGNDHVAPGSEVSLISNRVFIPDGRVYSIREIVQ